MAYNAIVWPSIELFELGRPRNGIVWAGLCIDHAPTTVHLKHETFSEQVWKLSVGIAVLDNRTTC